MKLPDKLGPFHIIGIGGIGMSAIAEVMLSAGLTVQGSDIKENANVARLREKGAKIHVGHDKANIEGAAFIVISTAVKPGNPELDAALEQAIPVLSRAEMLAELMRNRATISVTGTHGKTTTTSFIATILEKASTDPVVINGGILDAWGSNARPGSGDWMVVEADESDGTFLKLPTQIGVVTNIDPEHMDFYQTEERLFESFETFFKNIPFYGLAVAGIDNVHVKRIVSQVSPQMAGRRLLTYGTLPEADLQLTATKPFENGVSFDAKLGAKVATGETQWRDIRLSIPGEYNALNALAAIAVATELGVSEDVTRQALAEFSGVKRRFTPTGIWNGISFYDDYAHHPIEIEAVLKAAKDNTKSRVIAIMQPHRYSRLADLFEDFSACFNDADIVIVTPVFEAGEKPRPGINRDALVSAIQGNGHDAVFASEGGSELTYQIAKHARPGDLVIGLGAGTITDWANALPGWLAEMEMKAEKTA